MKILLLVPAGSFRDNGKYRLDARICHPKLVLATNHKENLSVLGGGEGLTAELTVRARLSFNGYLEYTVFEEESGRRTCLLIILSTFCTSRLNLNERM
jgi:hypothetical protein